MNLPVKREREETAAGVGNVVEKPQQQHAGPGSAMVTMESASAASAFGGGELRPAKLARHNDRGVEAGENIEPSNNIYVNTSKPGRDEGGSGLIEDMLAEENVSKEVQVQPLNIKFGEGKSDREGRDPGRTDLQKSESGGKVNEDAVKESSGNKELLARVNVKGEEQLLQPKRGSNSEVGQELVESNRVEGNSEGLRKKSPREDEGKVDVSVDVKREEPHEKEKEKKDEKRSERKEDVFPLVQQLLQPHLDVKIEKDNEKEEKDAEKGEKEKDRVRERERSRDKEKEAVRTEKREKREKERDRDPHRRERGERDESLADKEDNEEGKGVNVEDIDMVKKPVREVDERKLKEGRERVRERHREKERDDDGEGGKRKKRGRDQEKERDSLDTDGVGGEKDKDAVHSHGVQQRKRLLRPRGQSNPSNRDSRSRFRPKDNEGQDRANRESSSINYRAGEGMRELAKRWKEYCESGDRNISVNGSGPTVEIRIPAELATTANRKIRVSHLWGTDIYTDDSDIVAVLFHTGYCTPSASLPPNSISELRATIRIFESQKMYTSSLRNTVRSRAWGSGSGCSYSVERCRILKQGGGIVELEPCLTRTLPLFTTLAFAASERTVTTRAASSSAHRQQRFVQEVTIQYNLCNEPWPKYNMSIVADRGLKKSQFTSARLKKGEVLYVENHVQRYELAYEGERATCNGATTATSSLPQGTSGVEKAKEKNGSAERALEATTEKEAILRTHSGDKSHGNHPNNGQAGGHCQPHESYRWSKCKRPLPLSSMKSKGLPLPEEFVEVLEEGLAWEEVQWSPTSVWVRGTEYILNIAQFFSSDEL